MEIKQTAVLHNRFDVRVEDAVTGKCKQTAVGYNVITNYFFQNRIMGYPMTRSDNILTNIAVGTGTGTPAITDTALFRLLTQKVATTIETVFAYPTSHITSQIKLQATECNGSTITEVGFMGYDRGYTYLMTHAMLQDSEGNQIAIAKTDVDVVYITATFYVTYTPSGFGENGIYPAPADNKLVQWLLLGTPDSAVRLSRHGLTHSSELVKRDTGNKYFSFSGTGSMETLRLDLPVITFLDTECNNRVVRHLGIAGFGAFTFPDHSVFPPYLVDHLLVGEGDGITTEFNIQCPMIQAGTAKVYVNGTELTEGTDFTVDYESNCGDWLENYHTAGLTAQMPNVQLGNMREQPPDTSKYLKYDPIAWCGYYDTTFYPSYFRVTADKPIWFDFLEPKSCNRMKFVRTAVASQYLDRFVIEYSSDNETWTAVEYTRTSQVWSWDQVSARYWRIYIPNDTFTLSLYSYQSTPVDGQTFATLFFLGKTVPGLKLAVPPPVGASVEVSYSIDMPFKTHNNLLRFTCSIQLQRG